MELKDVVKEKYGQAALRVSTGGSSCCGAPQTPDGCDPITSNLYDSDWDAGTSRQSFARLRESDGYVNQMQEFLPKQS